MSGKMWTGQSEGGRRDMSEERGINVSEQWVWMKRGSESGKCGRMNRGGVE